MLFGYLLLLIALTISAVAAFYSIAGLTAIFAAAFWPIVIMGSVLELGKIVTTVWLHKYWDRAALQFKLYLVPAIAILMLITSMGIFGFLSKAHLDQAVPAGDISSQVQIFDDKIKTERDNIEAARKALKQMDAQVDEKLSRTTDDKGAERAVQIRRSQSRERTTLQNEISTAQKKISALQEQRAPIASQARKVEAEVGPIKYIAALIYGDNPDAGLLEKAVRWVIILIVLVFDPLALVLILAADQTFEWHRPRKRLPIDQEEHPGWKQVWQPTTEDPWHDDPKVETKLKPLTDPDSIDTQEFIKNIKQSDNPVPEGEETQAQILIDEDSGVKEFFKRGREVARALDAGKPLPEFVAEQVTEIEDIPVLEGEEMWAQQAIDDAKFDPQPIRGFEAPATDENPINPIPKPVVIHDTNNHIIIPDTGISVTDRPANTSFGTEFPENPQKGDIFLRVDYLPNRSYKWNGQKWIDVNKEYVYDEEYIKHLIDRIDRGEYDVELLSDSEQEQIQRYLNEQSNRK